MMIIYEIEKVAKECWPNRYISVDCDMHTTSPMRFSLYVADVLNHVHFDTLEDVKAFIIRELKKNEPREILFRKF